MVGDSVAISWLPAIRAALAPKGWTVVALTSASCPAAAVAITNETTSADLGPRCAAQRLFALQQIARIQPALAIMSSGESSLLRLTDGRNGAKAATEWANGTAQMITSVKSYGAGRIVVMAPPPAGRSLASCGLVSPSTCVSPVSTAWLAQTKAERTAIAGSGANVRYLDPLRLFCAAATKLCPAFVAGTPVRIDTSHLSTAYATRIGPAIKVRLIGNS